MRGDDVRMGGDVTARSDSGAGRYELRLLGPFSVLLDGEPLAYHRVGSRKARVFLKRLLVERDRVVTIPAFVEAIWPNGAPDRAERHVATLVSRLRAVLGSDVAVRVSGGYRFGGVARLCRGRGRGGAPGRRSRGQARRRGGWPG